MLLQILFLCDATALKKQALRTIPLCKTHQTEHTHSSIFQFSGVYLQGYTLWPGRVGPLLAPGTPPGCFWAGWQQKHPVPSPKHLILFNVSFVSPEKNTQRSWLLSKVQKPPWGWLPSSISNPLCSERPPPPSSVDWEGLLWEAQPTWASNGTVRDHPVSMRFSFLSIVFRVYLPPAKLKV